MKKGAHHRKNNPKLGSRIVTRKVKSGPNKGKVQRMREFVARDGRKHSNRASKNARGHRNGSGV